MEAEHFGRFEFRFLLSYDDMDRLMDDLIPFTEAAEHVNKYGIYTVSTLYFDNASRDVYYAAGDGRAHRRELRLRVYGKKNDGASDAYLELKRTGEQRVIKSRLKLRLDEAERFIRSCMEPVEEHRIGAFVIKGDEVYAEIDALEGFEEKSRAEKQLLKEMRRFIVSERLRPACVVSYERLPLRAKNERDLRLTFDFLIRSRSDELDLAKGTQGEKRCGAKTAVLEVKTSEPLPLWLLKILRKYGCCDSEIYKYCLHYEPLMAARARKEEGEDDDD